ncbi:MAG: NfeD family protein, partial [Limnobacter sp.]|nr:NfeD family protein [Limnobacter sp.]
MTEPTFWLVLAGVLVVAEIMTGTFYLLIVAVGALLGALTAYLGYPIEVQIGSGAVFAIIASLVLQSSRKKSQLDDGARNDKLDLGNLIEVKEWDANGMAKVLYRGAHWQAQCQDPTPS